MNNNENRESVDADGNAPVQSDRENNGLNNEHSSEPAPTSDDKQALSEVPITLARELIRYFWAALFFLIQEEQLLEQELRRETEMVDEEPTKRHLWTPEEASNYLGVSHRTVIRLARNGELDFTWVGGQRQFCPTAVKKYVRSKSSDRL